MSINRQFTLSAAVATVLACAAICPGGDHSNLEEGLPIEVQDAYPIEYRGSEIQAMVRYQRERDGTNLLTFRPIIECGVCPNTEVAIETDILAGNGDRTGCGNITLHALYNFNTESGWIPATAVVGALELPSGRNAEGVDSSVGFIATKSLFDAPDMTRVHVNIIYTHNARPQSDEREHLYKAVIGCSRPLTADVLFVADFVRERERLRGHDSNIVEAGIRCRLTPLTTLSFGVGAGIAEDSPDFRVTFGFQRSF